MSPLEERLAQVEAKLAQVMRDNAQRKPVREATPLAARRGWFLCVNHTTLSAGSTCDVEIWVRQLTDGPKWIPSGKMIEGVTDWFFNSGDSIEPGHKLKVEWYQNCWVATVITCEPSDDEDVIASLEEE